MASAWGSAWGYSWGNSWGTVGAPPDPPPQIADIGVDGRRRLDKAAEEFWQRRRRSEQALRQSVERAFRRADGIEDEQPDDMPAELPTPWGMTANQRHQLALYALALAQADGMKASLAQIERLLRDYERALEQDRDDDLAAAILLAVM